jgi:hypothetical protein
LSNAASARIEREIGKYEEEIEKLSTLFADQKIGEKSYLAATNALEQKIKRLKENPNPTSSSYNMPEESSGFEQRIRSGNHPTGLWYLVPFFFGIIGGLVGYVAVKDDDRGMADSLLVFGLIWSIILFLIGWAWITSLFH